MKQETIIGNNIIRQGGIYYLRYQMKGKRKDINFNTSDHDKAIKKSERLMHDTPSPSLHTNSRDTRERSHAKSFFRIIRIKVAFPCMAM